MLQPFLSFIFSKDNDQSNLPSINSGIFNDSENFSKLMISGDGYIPMRNDLLIGINYKNFGKICAEEILANGAKSLMHEIRTTLKVK